MGPWGSCFPLWDKVFSSKAEDAGPVNSEVFPVPKAGVSETQHHTSGSLEAPRLWALTASKQSSWIWSLSAFDLEQLSADFFYCKGLGSKYFSLLVLTWLCSYWCKSVGCFCVWARLFFYENRCLAPRQCSWCLTYKISSRDFHFLSQSLPGCMTQVLVHPDQPCWLHSGTVIK